MKNILLILITFVFIQGVKAQFTGGGETSSTNKPASASNNAVYLKFGTSSLGSDLKSMQFKNGYILEFGSMPYFSKNTQSKVNGGMIISDDIAFYGGGDHLNTTTNKNGKDLLMTIGMKIGPCISFSPVEKLFLEAYYGFHPTLGLGTIYGIDQTKINIFFMNAFGFNVRYSKLILGMEFDSGKMKYQTSVGTNKVNAPSTRLTIGFRIK